MRFKFNNDQYVIQFRYDMVDPDHIEAPKKKTHRGCFCYVHKAESEDAPSLSGWSACSPKDRFEHESARKKALTRALGNTQDKKFRTAAWLAYFTRGGMFNVNIRSKEKANG